jgi:hypothetical protein
MAFSRVLPSAMASLSPVSNLVSLVHLSPRLVGLRGGEWASVKADMAGKHGVSETPALTRARERAQSRGCTLIV